MIWIILGIGVLGFLLYREYQKNKTTKQEKINKKVLIKEKSLWDNEIFRYFMGVLLCALILVTTIVFMFIPKHNIIYGKNYLERIAKYMFMK